MKLIKALYIIAVALYYYVITGYESWYGKERDLMILVIIYGVLSLVEVVFKNFTVKKRGAR
jgi:hypothetical protein